MSETKKNSVLTDEGKQSLAEKSYSDIKIYGFLLYQDTAKKIESKYKDSTLNEIQFSDLEKNLGISLVGRGEYTQSGSTVSSDSTDIADKIITDIDNIIKDNSISASLDLSKIVISNIADKVEFDGFITIIQKSDDSLAVLSISYYETDKITILEKTNENLSMQIRETLIIADDYTTDGSEVSVNRSISVANKEVTVTSEVLVTSVSELSETNYLPPADLTVINGKSSSASQLRFTVTGQQSAYLDFRYKDNDLSVSSDSLSSYSILDSFKFDKSKSAVLMNNANANFSDKSNNYYLSNNSIINSTGCNISSAVLMNNSSITKVTAVSDSVITNSIVDTIGAISGSYVANSEIRNSNVKDSVIIGSVSGKDISNSVVIGNTSAKTNVSGIVALGGVNIADKDDTIYMRTGKVLAEITSEKNASILGISADKDNLRINSSGISANGNTVLNFDELKTYMTLNNNANSIASAYDEISARLDTISENIPTVVNIITTADLNLNNSEYTTDIKNTTIINVINTGNGQIKVYFNAGAVSKAEDLSKYQTKQFIYINENDFTGFMLIGNP